MTIRTLLILTGVFILLAGIAQELHFSAIATSFGFLAALVAICGFLIFLDDDV